MEFLEAGQFLKQRRKERGFKTQKVFIEALYGFDDTISCSLPYISLIEKGVKTPSVRLLNIMAKVLELTPHEKGELLLIYKRVPSDFEFTVRSNLKESLKYNTLDQVWKAYRKAPDKSSFDRLLHMLVLEERSSDALTLLKSAPNFSDNPVDLQVRAAQMAAVTAKYDFAIQGYQLALESCPASETKPRASIYLHLGIVYFSKGIQGQYSDPLMALEWYLKALHYLEQTLNLTPDAIFALDEYARCTYHIADGLHYFIQAQQDILLNKETPSIQALFPKKIKKITFSDAQVAKSSRAFFELAKLNYAQIISISDQNGLPQKPLKEAVYFYAYAHSKLGLFETSSVLIQSMIILDKNWLTYFIKACDAVLRYEKKPESVYLDQSLSALTFALDFDRDAVASLIQIEKERELKTLWQERSKALETLLKS